MTITFYPKQLLVTAVFVVMFGATLQLGLEVERGVATACVLAVLAYLLIEVFISVNPAFWWLWWRGGHDGEESCL